MPDTPNSETETRAETIERLEDEVEALERADRVIPLDDGEDDEGVGEVTHLVP